MKIKVGQIRAARAMLNWSQKDLAARAGISDMSIMNYENEKRTPHQDTLEKILQAFEIGGVELTDDGGVRPKKSTVITYNGVDGFKDWFNDIYISVSSSENPDVWVANADEEKFRQWLGDFEPTHMARIIALNIPKYKVLLRSNDILMRSSAYSEFRWMKTNQFADVCIYLYAGKSAFVEFQTNHVLVTVVDNSLITNAQRRIFNAVWEVALMEPPQQ